jgi:hypothetical protein
MLPVMNVDEALRLRQILLARFGLSALLAFLLRYEHPFRWP